MDEKIRFLEEKKFSKTLEKELTLKENSKQNNDGKNQTATNPIAGAFLRFVHFKHKFDIKDL